MFSSCSAPSLDVNNENFVNDGGFEIDNDVNNKTENTVSVQKLVKKF